MQTDTLSQWFAVYGRERMPDAKACTRHGWNYAVSLFRYVLNRPPTTADLTLPMLQRFEKTLLKEGYSYSVVNRSVHF